MIFFSLPVKQGQQISVQGQQVAQTADGQTIVYQPVNTDGSVLQQGTSVFCVGFYFFETGVLLSFNFD